MTARSRAALVVGALLLLSAAATAPVLAVGGDRGGAQPQTDDGSAVNQTLAVDLQENGNARWRITWTFELSSRNETAAFDDLRTDFEEGNTDEFGLAAYERASQLASDSTGREMEITDVSRDSERTGTATNGTGRLVLSFTWTSFGRVEGDRFYVDDVFTTDEGPWLERLDENQRLVIQPPEGYVFFDAAGSVTIRNGTIQWTGPQEFGPGALSATFEESTTGTTPTPTTPGGSGTTTADGTNGEDDGALLWAVLLVLGISVVALLGYLLVERDVIEGADGEAPTASSTAEADEGGDGPGPETAAAEAAAADDGGDSDEEDDAIDVELLSDEERVERLLEENGGRMKQANIVKETGWSNAKVSQLLSAMEDEGRIDKLRIGRENLISFPDEDVTEFDE